MVQTILSHVTIRRPFTAGDRNQTGCRDEYGMIARECSRTLSASMFDQRTKPTVASQDVAFGWVFRQIFSCLGENKIDLLRLNLRFFLRLGDTEVGRSNHQAVVPGNGEENSTIGSLRNH